MVFPSPTLLFFQLSHIELALRSHYKVRDSRDLGYGTLHMLAGLVKRQKELAGGGLTQVFYESALFARHGKTRLAAYQQTDITKVVLVMFKDSQRQLKLVISPMNRAEGGCEAVGFLGEMSKAQALASLLSCPLLEDLSEWSQWELIFKPLLGSLKDFIERNAGKSE